MLRKRGRPKKIEAKEFQYTWRGDQETAYRLATMAFEEDASKSEIIRDALRLRYQMKGYQ